MIFVIVVVVVSVLFLWSSVGAICIDESCTLPTLEGYNFSVCNTKTLNHSQSCIATCAEGFDLIGEADNLQFVCLNGVIHPPPPPAAVSCVEKSCELPYPSLYYNFSGCNDVTRSGEVCVPSCDCPAGFSVPSSYNLSLVCRQGQFLSPARNCSKPYTCYPQTKQNEVALRAGLSIAYLFLCGVYIGAQIKLRRDKAKAKAKLINPLV